MSWRRPLAIVLLLLGCSLVTHAWELQEEWTPNGLELTWSLDEQPATVWRNGRSWLELKLDDAGALGRPGEPALPLVSRLVELPVGSGLVVETLEEEWETVSGVVAPEQERVHTEKDLPLAWLQDNRVYAGREQLPAQPLLLGDPALLRGIRVRQVALVPARCAPGRGETQLLRSARYRLTFAGDDARATPLPALAASRRPELLPATLLTHPVLADEAQRTAAAANPGAYLVLARNATVSGNAAFTAWADWKRHKGHAVTVAGESQVGGWTATAIREYIRTALATWSDPPLYVALVGDPSNGSSDAYYLPMGSGEYDHYFTLADDVDHLADVAVGRISAENATQLATILNKIVYYETTPTQAGTAWLGRGAVCTGYDANSMIQQSRTIAQDMVGNGITAIDSSWYPATSASWVNSRFNAGISLYNYRGWIGMNGVDNTFISNAGNFINYGMPPVTAIFTCSTGDFDWTCETELFLRKGDASTPQGASAVMGFATSNTHTAYNNAIAGGFWSAFLDRGVTTVGPALLAGKLTLAQTLPPGDNNATNFSNWANLMGDPGMEMWAGVPSALTATLVSGLTTFPVGSSEIQVQVRTGATPVAGVLVCLYQNGLQSRGRTDANGRAWLSVAGATAGTVYLTASKHDHLPHRATVTAAGSQFPRLVNWNLPGDFKLQPGETVTFSPVVQNTGAASLTGLNLTLSSTEPGLTIVDGSASWNTISAGAQGTAANGLTVTASSSLADGARLHTALAWTSGQGNFSDAADLQVSAPLLQPTTLSFTPGGSILQPGATSSFNLTVTNTGSLAAGALTATLTAPGDPFVTVTQGTAAISSLGIGAQTTLNFTVQASGQAVRGHQVDFVLGWSGMGLTGTQAFTSSVGTPNVSGPTGPDAFGYRAIESTDANSLAPVYNWVEIAPQAGGSGTSLGLTDTGDELDDAATVTLPFAFSYYGQTYTQMAVCSNGFVAFGPGAVNLTDYRNHYLPSGLGPDAMIAVCWDDHIIPGGAGVYYKSEPANNRAIVEWYQLNHNGTSGINTFQLILNADGTFLTQYHTWTNNQSNSYDFPGCTVGIKDHDSAVGLTLTNYLINDPTMSGFSAGHAVLFTTAEGIVADLAPPSISVASLGGVQPGETPVVNATIQDASGVAWALLWWRVGAGAWQSTSMTQGAGDSWTGVLPAQPLGATVTYYVQAEDVASPPNGASSGQLVYTVVSGTPPTGPDSRGYRWYDSQDAGEGPDLVWMDISGQGTQLVPSDDVSTTIALPFPVVYFGTTFTQLTVCSNGWVAMGTTTDNTYGNSSMANGQGVANMVCAFWDDLNPGSGGQVRAATSADGNRFVVSWIGVPRYGTSNFQTFQLVFLNSATFPTSTGDTPVVAQYLTVSDLGSCTVGHQNSARSAGITYLNNGTYGANAAPVASGQALLLTTGAAPLPPVTDLTIQLSGNNVQLNWTGTGAAGYRVYGGGAYEDRGTVDALVTGTSVTLPVAGQRFFDVRGVRDYQGGALAAAREAWLPVEVLVEHPAAVK
jgi:hypothetical protein